MFNVPDEVQAKWPELVKLIEAAESMDDNDKQYWFDRLPSLSDGNVDRLFTILENERVKLAELELKYQEEIRKLNAKHLAEWQELQANRIKK